MQGSEVMPGQAIVQDMREILTLQDFLAAQPHSKHYAYRDGNTKPLRCKYDHVTGDCLWAEKADGFLYPDGSSPIKLSATFSLPDIFYTAPILSDPSLLLPQASMMFFAAKMDSDSNWQWATTAGALDSACRITGINIAADDVGNSYRDELFRTQFIRNHFSHVLWQR